MRAAPFAEEELTDDALLGGRVRLWQPRRGYRAATDPVLLAAACPAKAGERVLDLGCGAGAAALCLAARVPGAELHGVELQPAYAELARRNARRAGLAMAVHEGDAADPPGEVKGLVFDHVITNPPWHAEASPAAPDAGRDLAHREAMGAAEWVAAALRRVRPGGRLTLIHRAERLGAILAALEGRAGDARVLPLAGRQGRAAGRVIVQARKGARGALSLLWPLALHEGAAHGADAEDFSAPARAALREAGALTLDPRGGLP